MELRPIFSGAMGSICSESLSSEGYADGAIAVPLECIGTGLIDRQEVPRTTALTD
jgi:hypothetical protein